MGMIAGGTGQYRYTSSQRIKAERIRFNLIDAYAGGHVYSGITPMLQLIRSIAVDPADRTKCTLIFANQVSHTFLT